MCKAHLHLIINWMITVCCYKQIIYKTIGVLIEPNFSYSKSINVMTCHGMSAILESNWRYQASAKYKYSESFICNLASTFVSLVEAERLNLLSRQNSPTCLSGVRVAHWLVLSILFCALFCSNKYYNADNTSLLLFMHFVQVHFQYLFNTTGSWEC
jgi:hypothetical protein